MIFLKKHSFLTAILALSLGVMLLFKSAELSEGIRYGLSLCSYSVIPSLFPFMVLSVFICKSSAAEFFAVLLRPIIKILRIPSASAGALLASLIGGYPTAAKCINDLVLEGLLDRKTASKMLCYCVNAGPPFLISAVGIAVFGNIKTGFLLFAAQIVSSFAIAVFIAFFSDKTDKKQLPRRIYKPNFVCLVESVISAAESCFNMCAFIVLSAGVLELLQSGNIFSALSASPLAKALLCGFCEVTAGTVAAGEIKGSLGIMIAGAIASFSGVSVILQVAAATEKSNVSLAPFIVSRFFHAGITAVIIGFFLSLSPKTAAAFSIKTETAEAVLSASAPAAVSLLCMAALFLLSFVPPKSEKEPLFSRIKSKFAGFGHSQIK